MKEMLERKIVNNNTDRIFIRGEVYLADLPQIENSSIQSGVRPIIIVVNKLAGKNSPMVQYIPLTSEIKRTDLPVHAILNSGNLKVTSMALGEQLNAVDRERITKRIGKVSSEDMAKVDNIIMYQLGLKAIEYTNTINGYMKAAI
jgi:mRNA interferase MazF